ncbi:pyridoxamine 5'-phosphate oxidase family protein [Ruania alkalisoli]|uniref:Pyridoxamine 5'-phosphate oxidase family protein n=1 Tax=Ruania alkalisoli TaxID=2779775 RepID=A0A7M1SS25_9MICO|nr:pyridoxamine 5'-phosphate oxidase family protein [Ruania alkalisoli]QOR70295.1 pyridoxamine 5'-phosphate oxidase family protein [Ruania alkalisoli]
MDVRTWLAALPPLESSHLPPFDPANAPDDPAQLHRRWIADAAGRGLPAPHAVTLATAADRDVSARTVMLRDLSGGHWVFATDAASPKARQMARNPRAALTSFWPALGRQVRVTGAVRDLGEDAGARDFLARHPGSRAAVLTGEQSAPLDSLETYDRAYAEARDAVEKHPGRVPATWRCYAIAATTVEFWAARPSGGQIRLRYTLEQTWQRGLVWP